MNFLELFIPLSMGILGIIQCNNNEAVLEHIGVTRDNVRTDAFNHWSRFIDFCKKNSGKHWKNDIRPKLRSWIGVDFRYIDDYLTSCLAWNIIELKDDILLFKGIPETDVADSEPQSFMEYARKNPNKTEKAMMLQKTDYKLMNDSTQTTKEKEANTIDGK